MIIFIRHIVKSNQGYSKVDLRGISPQTAGLLIVVVILAAVAAYGWA